MLARNVSRYGPAAVVAALAIALPATVASAASAPGAPGLRTTWASADKDGFGTAFGRTSRVWFTLSHNDGDHDRGRTAAATRGATCARTAGSTGATPRRRGRATSCRSRGCR